MKQTLILLSILLLSSPLFGDNHKGETLYGWGNTLPYVWKGFGDKETHPKYEGEVSNGKPNGFGVLTYPYDEKSVVGEWKNGKYDGQVILTFPDGEKYEGEYKDGKYQGQGTYTWNNGQKYEGEFKDGKKWNGTLYDNDGINISKYINGVKQ